MADDDQVTFVSQDGQDFKIEVRAAKMLVTMKNLIEDSGIDTPIPVPNITGKVLGKVIEYCKYHTENPVVAPEPGAEKRTDDICHWDREFCSVDQQTLFSLLLAANFLDVKDLLQLVSKSIANLIKGKTPAEIRGVFNIKREFTQEEMDQVKKENIWAEER